MKCVQEEFRTVKSFCRYRSEILTSAATCEGPKFGLAKRSLFQGYIGCNRRAVSSFAKARAAGVESKKAD
jgi:hypothetical protein